MRNESLTASWTRFEGLDAIGIEGMLSATGVLVLRENVETRCFHARVVALGCGIRPSGIIGNLATPATVDDLNSVTPDGKWIPPLTAKASRDDIIHANVVSLTGPAATDSCRGLS